jgi:hypothetical protein
MPEPINPEAEIRPETPESHRETPVESVENKEATLMRGAEILENPPDGSFLQGLQTFIAWVKSIVASDDQS